MSSSSSLFDSSAAHFRTSSSSPMELLPSSPRSLLALAVFQDLRNAEYIRSIHLYHQHGTAFTIQQEFLLKPGSFSQISQPISSACFCSLSSTGLKHFMPMLKKMHEEEWWKCVLDFSSDSPSETEIIPLLSASRNPDLQTIPSLAEDLRLVEIAVSDRTFSHISFSDDGESSELDKHASNWPYPYWSIPAPSNSLPVEADHERGADSIDRIPQSLPLDLCQKWGSDLELASPRMSQTFDFSLRRNSATNASIPAAISTSSPSSSSFSSQNADSSCWGPTALPDNVNPMQDFPQQMLPISDNDIFSGPSGVLLSSLPNSLMAHHVQIGCRSRSNMLVKVEEDHFTLQTRKSDLLPQVKRTRSVCSKTGVGTHQICWSAENRSSKAGDSIMEETGSLSYMGRSGDEFPESNDGSSAISNDPVRGAREHRRKISSSEQSKPSRSSTDRLTELSRNELSQYFNMPITQASKELQVGLTVLKKRCREFGIPRWPHRKMKSLESLIHNIKDLTRDEEGNDTSRVRNAVKELEEQKKTMEDKPATELAERTKRLRQACFKANYKKRRQQQVQSTSHEDEEEYEEAAASDDYNYSNSIDSYNLVFPFSLITG